MDFVNCDKFNDMTGAELWAKFEGCLAIFACLLLLQLVNIDVVLGVACIDPDAAELVPFLPVTFLWLIGLIAGATWGLW